MSEKTAIGEALVDVDDIQGMETGALEGGKWKLVAHMKDGRRLVHVCATRKAANDMHDRLWNMQIQLAKKDSGSGQQGAGSGQRKDPDGTEQKEERNNGQIRGSGDGPVGGHGQSEDR